MLQTVKIALPAEMYKDEQFENIELLILNLNYTKRYNICRIKH